MHPFLKTLIKRFLMVFVGVFSFCFSLIVVIFAFSAFFAGLAETAEPTEPETTLEYTYGDQTSDSKLASLPINGVILGEPDVSDFLQNFSGYNVTYGYQVKDQLRDLAERDDIEGVILEINSPGGTIYGTQAIVDGVAEYKQRTNKPVVAYVSSLAASGAYWAAASADEIVADHGTALGSVGVIIGPFKYYDQVVSEDGGILLGGVETSGGIRTDFLTAGKYKDLGNPYRQLTDEERRLLQQSLDNSYNQFVTYVAEKRGIDQNQLRNTIGAMIYDDQQAVALKLANQSGNKESAYRRIAQLAGITNNDFQVVRQEHEDTVWSLLFEAASRFQTPHPTAFNQLCSLRTSVLALHGDVRTFCP